MPSTKVVLDGHGYNYMEDVPKKGISGKLVEYVSVSRPYVDGPPSSHVPMYVGKPADRAVFFLKFVKRKATGRNFDVFTFVDEAGNVFVNFSVNIQSEQDTPLAQGCCYIATATIKRHAEDAYNPGNIKQNHINRVKVLKTIGIKGDF
tara:strand:+ start:1761 stop:2204 length:444 start_codon:yes stop_codon:yes gene_type:complete